MGARERLIIFAKAPCPGQVKTRLGACLGMPQAARIHRLLTLHTLETASRHLTCPIELWCAPGTEHRFFRACRRRHALTLRAQRGKDLGERMAHAFAATLEEGGRAVLIGTDCPLLEGTHLQQAFDSLTQGHDAVLTPAEDGGYVLIGLSRHSPRLFEGIPWGGASVRQDTLLRLENLRWRWRELDRLWDIDTPRDLHRLLTLEKSASPSRRLRQLITGLRAIAGQP